MQIVPEFCILHVLVAEIQDNSFHISPIKDSDTANASRDTLILDHLYAKVNIISFLKHLIIN